MSDQWPVIHICISTQTLVFHLGEFSKSFSISTAKLGPGQLSGSGCTPLGHHIIRANVERHGRKVAPRVGGDQELGGVGGVCAAP